VAPIALAVVIIVTVVAGLAASGILAIVRGHYEVVVTSSRGVGRGQPVDFIGGDAVRIGIGFLATAVMLSGWAAGLAGVITRGGPRWATAALVVSALGFSVLVPALFPPWRFGRSWFMTGVYSSLVIALLLLEGNRRRRLNRIVVTLAVTCLLALIGTGLVTRSGGVKLPGGVGTGLLLAGIAYGHWLALGSRRVHR
jgi:hypothetical protein